MVTRRVNPATRWRGIRHPSRGIVKVGEAIPQVVRLDGAKHLSSIRINTESLGVRRKLEEIEENVVFPPQESIGGENIGGKAMM